MTELSEVLERLGLSQYLGRLIDEGFEKWETVLDITEQDLAALNFKLGHRRILQREIASARGIPPNQALVQPPLIPVEDPCDPEQRSPIKVYKSDNPKATATGKRKYRRHPKPDEHAPEKPPSAYVMFANRVRDEVKGQNLSFTDIAKLVGERWKVLDPEYKEEFEFEASVAKEKYQTQLAEYKKTDNYRAYLQYLSEFKQKSVKEGSEPTEAHRKRPKLESIPGDGSSGISIAASESNIHVGSAHASRSAATLPADRVGSVSSATTTSTPSSFPSPSGPSPSTPLPPLKQLSTKPPPAPSPISSPPSVTRYRDAIVKTTQEQQESLLSQTAHEMEPMGIHRMHPTAVHGPHIQQQLSYSRHQPPHPASTPSSSSFLRSTATPGPAMQRTPYRTEDSVSSSGNTCGPSIAPLDDSSRETVRAFHRALPLPTPTAQASPSIGYFDHRPHHPAGHPSPRHHGYPVLPAPSQLGHHSTYPASSVNTPQTSSSASTLISPTTLSSGSSQAPLTSQPPSTS